MDHQRRHLTRPRAAAAHRDEQRPGRRTQSRHHEAEQLAQPSTARGNDPQDPGTRQLYATLEGPRAVVARGVPLYLAATRSMKEAHMSATAALSIWSTFSAFSSPLCERLKLPA